MGTTRNVAQDREACAPKRRFAPARMKKPSARDTLTQTRIDNGTIRLVAGIHPDHRHRSIRAIQKAMWPALRNARRVIPGYHILATGHLTNRRPRNDGNRLVVSVIMTWQRRAWLEEAITAADAA